MLSPRRSMSCVAMLAFSSGSSGCHEKEPVLYPVLNERGLITYTTKDPYKPAFKEDRQAALLPHWHQREQFQVGQPSTQAGGMSGQERREQFGQEQRDIQADEDMRREDLREAQRQRQQQIDEERREREELREQKRQEDAMRALQRVQELEDAFEETRRQQEEIQRLHELNNERHEEMLRRPN